jgi:uncharacterized membrane protein
MESKTKLSGHPVRRVTMLLPLGLLVSSAVFDFAYIVTRRTGIAAGADWMIAAGVVAGLLAVPLSWLIWSGVPRGSRAKSIAWWHGIGQALLLLLFAASWLLRLDFPQNYEAALMFSFAGVAVALVTGWLGTELLNCTARRDDNNPKTSNSITEVMAGSKTSSRSSAELRSIR